MPPLILVQADREVRLVRRPGRYSIVRDLWAHPHYFEGVLKEAQERLIAGIRLLGYEYVDRGFVLQGPLPHYEFSGSSTIDPGPLPPLEPPPRSAGGFSEDVYRNYAQALAERAKLDAQLAALRAGSDGAELIDFRLHGLFRRASQPMMRTTTGLVVGGVGPVTPALRQSLN